MFVYMYVYRAIPLNKSYELLQQYRTHVNNISIVLHIGLSRTQIQNVNELHVYNKYAHSYDRIMGQSFKFISTQSRKQIMQWRLLFNQYKQCLCTLMFSV